MVANRNVTHMDLFLLKSLRDQFLTLTLTDIFTNDLEENKIMTDKVCLLRLIKTD